MMSSLLEEGAAPLPDTNDRAMPKMFDHTQLRIRLPVILVDSVTEWGLLPALVKRAIGHPDR
jgi:hypothetical protein